MTERRSQQAQIDALRIENERLRREVAEAREHLKRSEGLTAIAIAQNNLFDKAKERRAALKAGKDHGHE